MAIAYNRIPKAFGTKIVIRKFLHRQPVQLNIIWTYKN